MKLALFAFCFCVYHSGSAFAQVKPDEQLALIAQALAGPQSALDTKRSLLLLNQFDPLPADLFTFLTHFLTYSNPEASFSEAEEIRTLAQAILIHKSFTPSCNQAWSSPPQR